jgi:integrase
MALCTIYALGLRLGEGLRLETAHVDAERRMVWVRDGKGAKDRGVPLPRPLLARLRRYWKHERPASSTHYFFVPSSGQAPLHETTLQKTFTAAYAGLGLTKPPRSIRPATATPPTRGRHLAADHPDDPIERSERDLIGRSMTLRSGQCRFDEPSA